jgi:hypothetical protein
MTPAPWPAMAAPAVTTAGGTLVGVGGTATGATLERPTTTTLELEKAGGAGAGGAGAGGAGEPGTTVLVMTGGGTTTGVEVAGGGGGGGEPPVLNGTEVLLRYGVVVGGGLVWMMVHGQAGAQSVTWTLHNG